MTDPRELASYLAAEMSEIFKLRAWSRRVEIRAALERLAELEQSNERDESRIVQLEQGKSRREARLAELEAALRRWTCKSCFGKGLKQAWTGASAYACTDCHGTGLNHIAAEALGMTEKK